MSNPVVDAVSAGVSNVESWWSTLTWEKVKKTVEEAKDEVVSSIQKEVEEMKEGWHEIDNGVNVSLGGLEYAPFDENAEIPEVWKGSETSYRKWLSRIVKDLNTFRVDPLEHEKFDRFLHGYGDFCAQKCLDGDKQLAEARFKLVPKLVSEDDFWNNYFYRVYLIQNVDDTKQTKAILVKANTPTQEMIDKWNNKRKPAEPDHAQVVEEDTTDYTQLENDLANIKDNLSLLTSVLDQQDNPNEEQKKKKIELLQDLMRTVVRDKEKLALTLPTIGKESVMQSALDVNEQLQKAIVSYRTFMNKQEVKTPVAVEDTTKEFVSDQHLDDLENEEMQALRKELGLDSIATTPTTDTNVEVTERLPWEDDDDLQF